MKKHAPDLVAAQHMPFAFSVLHGYAKPVTVRICREDDACADFRRFFESQVVCAGIFRIRHLDGAEVRIRHFLFLYNCQVGQADLLQQPAYRHIAAAVQRGINDVQPCAFGFQQPGVDAERLDLRDVIIVHFPVADDFQQSLVQRLLLVHQSAVGVFRRTDDPGDACRGFRSNLRTVLAVDLVAVILRRIVARGNHDAGGGMQVAYRIAQHRHGPQRIKQVRGNAFPAQDQRRILCEFRAETPAVISDYDAALRLLRFFQQVSRQAFCSPAYIVFVHAVHACSQYAAHTGGTEAQFSVEAVFNFLLVVPDCFQLADGFLVTGKILQPFFVVLTDRHRFQPPFI